MKRKVVTDSKILLKAVKKLVKMFKKHFLSIFVSLLLTFPTSHCGKYECYNIWNSGTYCEMANLRLPRNDSEIELPQNSWITKITLERSIPILSCKSMCKSLPNLEEIIAKGVYMTEIAENAFEGCEYVKKLDLRENRFARLGVDTFKGLTHLETLWISGGNIPVFNVDLTDLQELKYLALINLKIGSFPADIVRELTNLESLEIHSNNLFDLDVERMIIYMPNMNLIRFNDNNLKCSRVAEIRTLLAPKKVKVETDIAKLKQRFYTPEIVDGFYCLTDERWETESVNGVTASPILEQRLSEKLEAVLKENKNLPEIEPTLNVRNLNQLLEILFMKVERLEVVANETAAQLGKLGGAQS